MLRVPLDLAVGGAITLPEDASRYVARVHRLAVGDAFVAFDARRRTEADARVLAITRDRVRVDLSTERPSTRLPTRAVSLFQGLAKADKMDAIVRDATELGATAIVPVRLARSVPQGKSDAAIERWGRVALEAARQCGRGDVPEIVAPVTLAAALDRAFDVGVALAPGAARSLHEVVASAPDAASFGVFVGPEGGFEDGETALLAERGLVLVRLGSFVLRTETAATAALAVIAAASLSGGLAVPPRGA